MMDEIKLSTSSKEEFVEITGSLERAVSGKGWDVGVLFIYVPHTTAGVFINENADPSVARDIKAVSEKLAPANFNYSHAEGNSPGHVKSVLFNQSLFVFVEKGRLLLGTWQGVFFAEFDGPRSRRVWMKFVGG